jgi:cytochrome c oxidase cbb3-type subunit III
MKKTKSFLIILLALVAIQTMAIGQAADAKAAAATGAWEFPKIMGWVLGVAGASIAIIAMGFMLKVNQILYRKLLILESEKRGLPLPESFNVVPEVETGDDFWTRMRKKYWEDAVPVEREGEIMLHHAYDGIRELDNSLPPWWVNLFIACIVWSAGYMWFYHWGGGGLSSGEAYKEEVATAKKEIAMALAGKANAVDESNVVALTENSDLSEGELIFKNSCAACHGQLGEGGVGPNFTDENWIHGGGIKNVFKTIKYGVPEKGMISWQSQLNPAAMQKVASYILSLKGTNPPNSKAPQGEIWVEAGAAADTTGTMTKVN